MYVCYSAVSFSGNHFTKIAVISLRVWTFWQTSRFEVQTSVRLPLDVREMELAATL